MMKCFSKLDALKPPSSKLKHKALIGQPVSLCAPANVGGLVVVSGPGLQKEGTRVTRQLQSSK